LIVLGAVLIGIGLVYQRLIFAKPHHLSGMPARVPARLERRPTI
jgi:hypothetical protein